MDKIQTLHELDHPDVNVFPNILAENIPSLAIGADKIADGAIISSKLQSGSIVYSKLKTIDLTITDAIPDSDWTDSRFFSDTIRYLLKRGARFYFEYNNWISDISVAVNSYIGSGAFSFHPGVSVPASQVLSGNIASFDDDVTLSVFRTDFGSYIHVMRIDEN